MNQMRAHLPYEWCARTPLPHENSSFFISMLKALNFTYTPFDVLKWIIIAADSFHVLLSVTRCARVCVYLATVFTLFTLLRQQT